MNDNLYSLIDERLDRAFNLEQYLLLNYTDRVTVLKTFGKLKGVVFIEPDKYFYKLFGFIVITNLDRSDVSCFIPEINPETGEKNNIDNLTQFECYTPIDCHV